MRLVIGPGLEDGVLPFEFDSRGLPRRLPEETSAWMDGLGLNAKVDMSRRPRKLGLRFKELSRLSSSTSTTGSFISFKCVGSAIFVIQTSRFLPPTSSTDKAAYIFQVASYFGGELRYCQVYLPSKAN